MFRYLQHHQLLADDVCSNIDFRNHAILHDMRPYVMRPYVPKYPSTPIFEGLDPNESVALSAYRSNAENVGIMDVISSSIEKLRSGFSTG